MHPSSSTGSDGASPRTVGAWSTTVVTIGVLGAALSLSLVPGPRGGILAGLSAASVLAWSAFGPRALRAVVPWSRPYLLSLTVLLGVASALEPNATGALFAIQPQAWLLTPTARRGAAWSVTMTVVAGLAALTTGRVDPVQLTLVMGGTLAYGLVLGTWIARERARSQERAALLDRLRLTQDELLVAHREEAIMAEREHMSREIHDTLAQGFLSIMAQARAATAEARRATATVGVAPVPVDHPVLDRLRRIEDTARDNLAEARSLVAVSAPPGLEEDGLRATVARLATRFAGETGVDADTEFDPDPDGLDSLSPAVRVVVVRAVQESLANVRKHARATSVVVALHRRRPDRLALTVTDDGVGMTAGTGSVDGSYGLRGLRDRVELVGGTVDVDSAPGRGTTLSLTIPTPEEAR